MSSTEPKQFHSEYKNSNDTNNKTYKKRMDLGSNPSQNKNTNINIILVVRTYFFYFT